jgi:hypothetical protein
VAPSALREGIPPDLERAILGCLRKNPDERSELVELSRVLARLAPARAKASLERIEATLGTSPVPSSQATAEPPARVSAKEGREGRGRRGALVLLVIGAAGVLGIGLTTGRINSKGLRREVSGATSAVTSAAGAVSSAIASAVASSLPDLPPADESAPSASGEPGEVPLTTRPTASVPGVAPTQGPQHSLPAKPHQVKPHHAAKPWRRGH